MKNLLEIKSVLSHHKQVLVNKYGLKFIAIFGSYTRAEQRKDSDIDILVDFDIPIGIEFIDLADELEEILKQKVDLVSKNGVKPKYLELIEEELIYV